MYLFTSARTAAIVFARSAGSEAMYCAGVLTFDGGFMGPAAFPNPHYTGSEAMEAHRQRETNSVPLCLCASVFAALDRLLSATTNHQGADGKQRQRCRLRNQRTERWRAREGADRLVEVDGERSEVQ